MSTREGWLPGCIDYAEEMHSATPHEHNVYCEVIARAMEEDRRAEQEEQQIAINTDTATHADTCNRKRRAPGELFDSFEKRCTCHVVQLVRESIRRKYGE